jgi:dTDP-4-dehydrorhamnose 3,5-epimerase
MTRVRRSHRASPSPLILPQPIAGVRLVHLNMQSDDRGTFTELYRAEWGTDVCPVQWNFVRSGARVLRGVHVHLRHSDYLCVVRGRAVIGLRDLRRGSPTEGVATLLSLDGRRLQGLVIPPGVAHGFYFPTIAAHVYSVSHYWDPADELGCRWNDPELGIPWPLMTPRLSPRDEALPTLKELLRFAPLYRADTRS